MILSIKKCLFAWYIYDENKKVVSKIRSKRFWGPAKNIFDYNNITVYTTDIINEPNSTNDQSCASIRKYVLYKSGEPIVIASLTFAANSKNAANILRPPQVDEMLLETPYGVWRAKRQKDNGIIFYQNEQRMGEISPFFRLKPHIIEFDEKYNITFFAGLYVLTEYMMHEDDLIIV
jgi:hypothetical protein